MYPVVPNSFKSKQKSPSGRLIPFESIDTSLYNEAAHCVGFTTTEDRIHYWISALERRLFVNKGLNPAFNVGWHDVPEIDCTQTEFIISESTCSEKNFMYKVVVYFTTGKILVQGKAWQIWCNEEFKETLQIVNELTGLLKENDLTLRLEINDDDQTFRKEIVDTDYGSTKENEESVRKETVSGISDLQALVHDFQMETDDIKITTAHSQTQTKQTIETIDNEYLHTSRRIDVLESALCNVTDTLATILQVQYDIKNLNKSPTAPKSMNKDNEVSTLSKSVKEKDHQINNLQKEISSLQRDRNLLEKKLQQAEFDRIQVLDLKSRLLSGEKDFQKMREKYDELNNEKMSRELEAVEIMTRLKTQIECYESSEADRQESIRLKDCIIQDLELRLKSESQQDWTEVVTKKADNRRYISDTSNQSREQNSTNMPPGSRYTPLANLNENEPDRHSIDHDIVASDREIGDVIETRKSNPERNEETQHDMLLLHDSVCKNIDMKRLSDRTNFNGTNIPTSDLRQAENVLDDIQHAGVIILHVGVNDLKSKSVEDTFSLYNKCVIKCLEKADRVIISLLTPCRQQPLSSKVV